LDARWAQASPLLATEWRNRGEQALFLFQGAVGAHRRARGDLRGGQRQAKSCSSRHCAPHCTLCKKGRARRLCLGPREGAQAQRQQQRRRADVVGKPNTIMAPAHTRVVGSVSSAQPASASLPRRSRVASAPHAFGSEARPRSANAPPIQPRFSSTSPRLSRDLNGTASPDTRRDKSARRAATARAAPALPSRRDPPRERSAHSPAHYTSRYA
jgi:hypothetical protein